jgi:hypothetical protein
MSDLFIDIPTVRVVALHCNPQGHIQPVASLWRGVNLATREEISFVAGDYEAAKIVAARSWNDGAETCVWRDEPEDFSN